MTSAQKLADGIDGFIDLVGRATAWLALGLALVMGANVLLRYGFSIGFLNQPVICTPVLPQRNGTRLKRS